MKVFGGTLFGFLTGIIATLLFTAYIDSAHSDRDNSIVNTTARNMIKELNILQEKRDTLSNELKVSDEEVQESMHLLMDKDSSTKEALYVIKTYVTNKQYIDAELLLEQKLKEGQKVYFYALLLKNIKNSNNIYTNLKDVEGDFKLKVDRYNTYKDKYALYLQKKNKVSFK